MTLEEMRIYIANRFQAAGVRFDYSVEQFNIDLKKNNLLHFKQKTGLPEQYTPGAPVPSQIPELTEKMLIDLAPFVVTMGEDTAHPLGFSDGIAGWPANMYYPISASNGTVDIDIVTNREYTRRLGSRLEAPSSDFPIMRIIDGKFQLNPSSITSVKFTYYRFPASPHYATKVEHGVNVFDAANTIEFEWDMLNRVDILWKMLSDLGITANKSELFNISEILKQKGA